MKVIAHRGYSGKYPENTMLSFQKAVEAGCDGIELDIHVSKDGVTVIIHDETLDRTTDGEGPVRDYTYEELKQFNAAKGFGHITDFEPIPTFEEYCRWAAAYPVTTNIEIKTDHYPYEQIEEKAVELVKRYGLEERVVFSSFNHGSLTKVKKLMPRVKCGALIESGTEKGIGHYCRTSGFEYAHPEFDGIDQTLVDECKSRGIGMNVWNVNDLEQLEKLYYWDCDGVITNDPERFKSWISEKESGLLSGVSEEEGGRDDGKF